MTRKAHVRMRGAGWDISIGAAVQLERDGLIWRDYDCEQNTRDNGYPDAGPCYGVTGDEDSRMERATAGMLDGIEWREALDARAAIDAVRR